ncbi:MAG: bZIP transcription factor [Pirellulaceae bacterium]
MIHHRKKDDFPVWFAARSAPWLFSASLAFLICQAILVVMWVDVPNLRETLARENGDTAFEAPLGTNYVELTTLVVMLLIWPVVIGESILHWCSRPWNRQTYWFHFYSLVFCISPSLRMCARSVEMGKRLWLPGLGWRQTDNRLRRRLERRFSVPMIWIALLILPVLVIELWLKNQVADYRWIRLALHISTGVIWFSFAAEFILMVSVAEKKIAYIKQHWIDLAIILLPLLSFMRSLRLLKLTGVSQIIRISQLNQIARTYRLRGTAMRALRALILLDLFQRLARRSPQKQIAKLQIQLDELESEAKQLRRKIARLQREVERDAQQAQDASSPSATAAAEDPHSASPASRVDV